MDVWALAAPPLLSHVFLEQRIGSVTPSSPIFSNTRAWWIKTKQNKTQGLFWFVNIL